MELELIEEMPSQVWDDSIERFDTKNLFHQSAWLRFLEETQGGRTLRFRISGTAGVEGYFVGLVVKKGPLRVLGSPMPGWTTDFMGPVVNKGFDFGRFLDALDDKCRELGIHHVELCNPSLPPDLLGAKGYKVENACTFIVPLFEEEKTMWDNLQGNCRQNIRKGISKGLRVEAWDGPAFVNEYYAELVDVFARQKLVPTYPIERVMCLVKNLSPGAMLGLRVMSGDTVIATGVFPYDKRSGYMFGSASWRKFQGLYPNELLFWTAMVMLAKKGVKQLDLCGDGSFKPKFGSKRVDVYRCSKSFSLAAKWGREVYRKVFMTKQALLGRLSALGTKIA